MRRKTMIGAAALAAAAGGWWWMHPAPPTAPAPAKPVQVLVETARKKGFDIWLDAVGTAQAQESVVVHPRIDGELVEVLFQEGQDVRAGDAIARIDSRTYKAAVDQAVAQRDKDQAQLGAALADLKRYRSLGDRVSQQTTDNQAATAAQLEAAVRSDMAALANAKAQLSWTEITSPISGRAGLRNVDRGNVIHASDASGLTTISRIRPMGVVFSIPQQELRRVNRELAAQGGLLTVAVEADGKTPLDVGSTKIVDNQIDAATGTVKLKAVMPNDDLFLWPGSFVPVRLLAGTRTDGVVVPTSAVQRGPKGAFAYVVGADSTAQVRELSDLAADGEETFVGKGLSDGDVVVVEGGPKLQPGVKVASAAKNLPKDGSVEKVGGKDKVGGKTGGATGGGESKGNAPKGAGAEAGAAGNGSQAEGSKPGRTPK